MRPAFGGLWESQNPFEILKPFGVQKGFSATRKSLHLLGYIIGGPVVFGTLAFIFLLSPSLGFFILSAGHGFMVWRNPSSLFFRFGHELRLRALFVMIGIYSAVAISGGFASKYFGHDLLFIWNLKTSTIKGRVLTKQEDSIKPEEVKTPNDIFRWIDQTRRVETDRPSEERLALFRKIEELCSPGYPSGFLGYICKDEILKVGSFRQIKIRRGEPQLEDLLKSQNPIARVLIYRELHDLRESERTDTQKAYLQTIEKDMNPIVQGFIKIISELKSDGSLSDEEGSSQNSLMIIIYPKKATSG